MGRGPSRNWWPLLMVTGLAVPAAWLLYLLWRSKSRDDLSTYGAFALPVALLIGGWLAGAWRKGKDATPAAGIGREALDQAADQLAAATQEQWKQAAEERGLTGPDPVRVTWGRPSRSLAGPPSAATGSHRFDPIPGLAETSEADLASGQASDLHALYGGLRSGRLVIAGPPGSGKTGAAVLLLLDALRYRERAPAAQRPVVPVPVLFTAQDWDPQHQPAADWLTRKLQDTYPLFASGPGAAAALLASGKITVILDGLDEISPELRPVALQALSQQATFRLVILSRTSEMADAASARGGLRGAAAIELSPVSPADTASYLQRIQLDPPPAGWQELTRSIRTDPDGPLTRALASPLALTLVRDTYYGEGIRELLQFCGALPGTPADKAIEAITGHLLDRVLPAAYASRPGQRRPYDLETAQRALIAIAAQMNHDGTRDLNWWEIPKWVPRTPRVTISTLVFGLVGGLVAGLVAGLAYGLAYGLASGLVVGLVAGLVAGLAAGASARPQTIGDLRLTKALNRSNLTFALVFGLVGGLVAGLAYGLAYGLASGLVSGLGVGLVVGLSDALGADLDSSGVLNPVTSWHRNQTYGLVFGLVSGLVFGLVSGLVAGLAAGLAHALAYGLAYGLVAGVVAVLVGTETYPVSLASTQLAIKWGTPARLMRFLDDAHQRDVLRVVGPAYQFRHARLQDRLAAAHPGNNSAAAPADQTAVSARAEAAEPSSTITGD